MANDVEITIKDHTDDVLRELDSAVMSALEQIGLVAEGYAKQYCPVDTGRLKNSISHGVDTRDDCAVIGTNVEYAPYVELGTSRHDPQPYLKPAITEHISEYKAIVERELKN